MDSSTHHASLFGQRAMGNSRRVLKARNGARDWNCLGGWAGTGLMVSTLLVMCPAARAETLTAWQFDPATQQFTLTLTSGVTPQFTVEGDPARIVLTIPQTQVGSVANQQTYSGAVSQVRLSQVEADTVVVLDLAPDTVLAAEGASLVAIAAGDQTRWVLTALVTPANAPSLATDPQMVVELPIIPGNDPRLGFPAAGTGRLSTSAANLMLPSDIDNLTNLPETLPVDPFNLGQPGEQVAVPSLAELDAEIGPVATAPQLAAVANPAQSENPGTLPPVAPPAGTTSVLTLEPPSVAAIPTPSGSPTAAEPTVAETPEPVAEAPEPAVVATIDTETSGVPIAVTPPESPVSETPIPETPNSAPLAVEVPEVETPAIAVSPPATPAAPTSENGSAAIAAEPPTAAAPSASQPSAAIAADPQPLPNLAAEPTTDQPDGAIASQPNPANPNAINQGPPPVATLPVELAGSDPNLLSVPNAPSTASRGTVVPPETPIVIASAGEPILFGSPLPNGSQAAFPDAVNPAPAERPLAPDTLVAAGTVLELRYVGDEPLALNTSSSQNQVLVLAQDIRDPITNGIVAPAGSQLIGQFESNPQGQQWVSKMLIAPAGQQVSFSTTSDYIVGSPDVSPPRLAAGAGLGALALLLLTGFTGIGLVGGALVGATTVVGTSPQNIVIEPNQIIQVQVIQDIPRAIPIASAPENSREWGAGGW